MPDENNTGSTPETVKTEAPSATQAPASKKTRAARQPKAKPEVVSDASASTIKSKRSYRKKDAEQSNEPSLPVSKKPATGKGLKTASGKATVAAPSIQNKTAPLTAADEMADLLQLEEENKSLRKALSDKLRSENADLRKRLGA
jgi:putative transposase